MLFIMIHSKIGNNQIFILTDDILKKTGFRTPGEYESVEQGGTKDFRTLNPPGDHNNKNVNNQE